MAATHFDTLSYVTELEKVDVSPSQVKMQVKLLSEILETTMCTKQDLNLLESNLKQEISQMRQEVLTIESHLKKRYDGDGIWYQKRHVYYGI